METQRHRDTEKKPLCVSISDKELSNFMTSPSFYSLSTYDYHLPQELIAQHPCSPRDQSRLMVVNRSTGEISEMVFRDLTDWMQKGDSFVFNDTKVIPARLLGKKETGGQVEIFLYDTNKTILGKL